MAQACTPPPLDKVLFWCPPPLAYSVFLFLIFLGCVQVEVKHERPARAGVIHYLEEADRSARSGDPGSSQNQKQVSQKVNHRKYTIRVRGWPARLSYRLRVRVCGWTRPKNSSVTVAVAGECTPSPLPLDICWPLRLLRPGTLGPWFC